MCGGDQVYILPVNHAVPILHALPSDSGKQSRPELSTPVNVRMTFGAGQSLGIFAMNAKSLFLNENQKSRLMRNLL